MTSSEQWKVGSATITAVVEAETAHIPPEFFFPEATSETVRAVDWCFPDYVDEQGNLTLRVQAIVVEVGARRVLVDPCVGNAKVRMLPFWNDQQFPWLERFAAAGYDPGSIDTVVHTHLHADHVGWDTQLVDGNWVPTFTSARHLYTAAELDFARASVGPREDVYGDSIEPVFAAGLADVVALDADLGDGLRLAPTPGHTPGHVSLWIESDGEVALISGDATHHPVQLAHPEWAEIGDADVDVARSTRRELFADAAARGVLFVGTHYPTRPAGRVIIDDGAFRFVPIEGTAVA